MSNNNNNKKVLAEKLKEYLNSPEYVDMPDLISGDYHGSFFVLDPKWKGHDGWIHDMRKGSLKKVKESQLEPNDWEEIVNLIEKRNKEKEQIWETKRKNIEEKLNQQSNLYYYWGKGDLRKNERADGRHSHKDGRGFCRFLGGNGNGLTHHLYIAENHPVLDNFSFQTGFYLIDNNKVVEKLVGNYEGGFGCAGGETNPNNFYKYVEVSDQITITPYQVEESKEPKKWKEELRPKSEYDGCSICHKKIFLKDSEENFYAVKRYHGGEWGKTGEMWICQSCYPAKEQEFLQNYAVVVKHFDQGKDKEVGLDLIKMGWVDCYAGHKDQNGKVLKQENCSHCQPWKKPHQNLNVSEIDIKTLIQYLQKYSIKAISFKNGELVITHNNNNNNNKIVSAEKINDKQELALFRDIIQKSNQQKLTKEDLEKMLNNNSNSASNEKPKGDNTLLWVGGGLGGILIIGIIIGLVVSKKRKNK